jgi:hypothetical protein
VPCSLRRPWANLEIRKPDTGEELIAVAIGNSEWLHILARDEMAPQRPPRANVTVSNTVVLGNPANEADDRLEAVSACSDGFVWK